MSTVNIDDIQKAFDDLITGKRSREEISDWAVDMRRAHDNDMLKFLPKDKKKIIWEGLEFLSGVDMIVDAEGNYMYFKEDFIYYKNEYS